MGLWDHVPLKINGSSVNVTACECEGGIGAVIGGPSGATIAIACVLGTVIVLGPIIAVYLHFKRRCRYREYQAIPISK